MNFIHSLFRAKAVANKWDLDDVMLVTRIVEYPLTGDKDLYCVVRPAIGKSNSTNIFVLPRFPWIKRVEYHKYKPFQFKEMRQLIESMPAQHQQTPRLNHPPSSSIFPVSDLPRFHAPPRLVTPSIPAIASIPAMPIGSFTAKVPGKRYSSSNSINNNNNNNAGNLINNSSKVPPLPKARRTAKKVAARTQESNHSSLSHPSGSTSVSESSLVESKQEPSVDSSTATSSSDPPSPIDSSASTSTSDSPSLDLNNAL